MSYLTRLRDVTFGGTAKPIEFQSPTLLALVSSAADLRSDSFSDEYGVTWYSPAHVAFLSQLQRFTDGCPKVRLYPQQTTVLAWAIFANQLDCPVGELSGLLAELDEHGIDGLNLVEWIGLSQLVDLEVAA